MCVLDFQASIFDEYLKENGGFWFFGRKIGPRSYYLYSDKTTVKWFDFEPFSGFSEFHLLAFLIVLWVEEELPPFLAIRKKHVSKKKDKNIYLCDARHGMLD